jgi:hypothetical protein
MRKSYKNPLLDAIIRESQSLRNVSKFLAEHVISYKDLMKRVTFWTESNRWIYGISIARFLLQDRSSGTIKTAAQTIQTKAPVKPVRCGLNAARATRR